MESAFRVKPPVASAIPDILQDVTNTLVPLEDETANMLVIPINKEIAPDFSLIGYGTTVRRIEEVLTQQGKQRNVLLYGDNGVGKTAIIHGLVQRKNKNDLSTHMYKRMFYRLNTSRLLHTDDASEINKQFDQALMELGHYDVLVIENFYTLVTYLKAKNANFLLVGFLEALSRRRLQSIITCSTRERTLLVNEIPEIHEFFAPEKLSEPSDEDLLNILLGVYPSYEKKYSISFAPGAVKRMRDLTQKYRTGFEGWSQPGRALILMDRTIAQFSVTMNSKPDELTELETKAETLTIEINSLTGRSFYEQEDVDRRETLVKALNELTPRLEELRKQWEETTAPIRKLQQEKLGIEKKHHDYSRQRRALADLRKDDKALVEKKTDATTVATEIANLDKMIALATKEIDRLDGELSRINLSDRRDNTITEDHVNETFSELSSIAVSQLSQNDKERVLHMEETLGERVFGQSEALRALAVAVRRAQAGLSNDEGTPKGSYLFLGPSGVGKTESGKALAEFVTGHEKNMIRLDMSEYMEKHSVSRLIGAPPGYAGYDEGGVLTNAVLAQPQAIIMFDEVEKAHEDIFKVLLQVLGDGRLTDGQGNTVNFKETYIILTSNIGTPHFLNEEFSYDQAAQMAKKEVEHFFAPELRGRLDGIICFRRLGLDLLERVADRRIGKLNKTLETNKLKLNITPENVHAFCEKYQDSRYGARAILKAMKTVLEDQLSTAVLSATSHGTLVAQFDGTTFSINYQETK